jgi:hypothetical protein
MKKEKKQKHLEKIATQLLKKDELNQKLKQINLPSGSLDIFFND